MATTKLDDLIAVERTLNLPTVVSSGFPIIKKEEPKLVAASVTVLMTKFLNLCFPNQPKEEMILEFAEEIIRNRYTWNLCDLVMFFKFIKERQDIPELKVFGNSLSYFKLMEMVAVYEYHRAEALEQYHQKNKIRHVQLNDLSASVAKRLEQKNGKYESQPLDGVELDRIQADRERTGRTDLYPQVNHQQFFEK